MPILKPKPKEIKVSHSSELRKYVFEAIECRRTIRKYKKKPVEDSKIKKILEAAIHAPSAGNYQPWEFVVIKNPKTKKLLAEACFEQDWIEKAPVIIAVGINVQSAEAVYGERGKLLYGTQGTAAAIQNILLSAYALGLGSAWVGAFSEPHVSIILRLPEYVRPCALVTIGYPDELPFIPERHLLKDVTHKEKFLGGPQPRVH